MQGRLDRHDIPIRAAASSQHIPGNMTIATTKAVTALLTQAANAISDYARKTTLARPSTPSAFELLSNHAVDEAC